MLESWILNVLLMFLLIFLILVFENAVEGISGISDFALIMSAICPRSSVISALHFADFLGFLETAIFCSSSRILVSCFNTCLS